MTPTSVGIAVTTRLFTKEMRDESGGSGRLFAADGVAQLAQMSLKIKTDLSDL